MIEAKLVYRARCEVCRKPFGPEHETQMREMIHSRNFFSGAIRRDEYEVDPVYYDGPHVCPACVEKERLKANAAGARDAGLLANVKRDPEQSVKIVNGMNQSLHDNLIGMGFKKEKGEE